MPALAQPGGPYLEATRLTLSPRRSTSTATPTFPGLGTVGLDGEVELDDAARLRLRASGEGLALGPGGGRLRLEANASWRENDIDGLDADGLDIEADGELGVLVGLANAYYNFDLGLPLAPYLGGGGRGRPGERLHGKMAVCSTSMTRAGRSPGNLAAGLGYELGAGSR